MSDLGLSRTHERKTKKLTTKRKSFTFRIYFLGSVTDMVDVQRTSLMEGSLPVFSASSFGSSFLILPMSAFRSFALSPFRFLPPAFLSSHFLCAFHSLFFFLSSIYFFSSSSFQIIIFPESILCSHIFSSFPLMLPFHLPLLYFPVFHLSIFYLSLSHILIFYFPFLFHLSNIHLQAFILVFFHLFPLVLPLLSFPYPELCSLICSYLSFFQFRGAERPMGGAGSLPEGALRKGKRIPRESILMIC